MREIYISQGGLTRSIIVKYGNKPDESVHLSSLDGMLNYFKHDPMGALLRDRKNLNIILKTDNNVEREKLEESLRSISFKRAYVSYDTPYDKAKKRYELNKSSIADYVNS